MSLEKLYPKMEVNRVYGMTMGREFWENRLRLIEWAMPIYVIAFACGLYAAVYFKNWEPWSVLCFVLIVPAVVLLTASWQAPFVRLMSYKVGQHWLAAVLMSMLGFLGLLFIMVFNHSFVKRARVAVLRLGLPSGVPLVHASTGASMSRDYYESEFQDWQDQLAQYIEENQIPTTVTAFHDGALLYGYGAKMSPEEFLKVGYRQRANLEDFPNMTPSEPISVEQQLVHASDVDPVEDRLSKLGDLVNRGLVDAEVAAAKQAEILKDL